MESLNNKQIRSISVDITIYNRFRNICIEKGLIGSVQIEHMMAKFIRENEDFSSAAEYSTGSKNN